MYVASKDQPLMRCCDLGGAIIASVCLAPVFLAVSLAILIDDGRPIFFRQKRVGKNGELFEILKFRTMRAGGGGRSITVAGDSRITRVGARLRRYKIDELPQFLSVIKGDMSLIGPRPE